MFRVFFINFLLAISTTVGMAIIPFLITDSLGLSLLILGLIEGISEFLSNLFRLANGVLFDKIKNKRLIFIGSTGIAFVAKALLLLPSSWTVLFSKVLERIANGTFASPRDAFVASQSKNKGMALGILNVSKTLGCILGPLMVSLSTLLLGPLKDNLHLLVIFCCFLVAVSFLFSMSLKIQTLETSEFSFPALKNIVHQIGPILIIAFLFFMGRFNDGLIMVHLKQQTFPEWFYLSAIAIFNAIMLISSPVIGRQLDKGQLKRMLALTAISLALFNLCFFQIQSLNWTLAIMGLLSWGIQRASAQIVFAALVFNNVTKEHYGTAIGLYYIISGTATMLSSFFCGYIANQQMMGVFLFSGFFSLVALLAMAILNKRHAPIQSTIINSSLRA